MVYTRVRERMIPCDGIVCSARQPREQTWSEKNCSSRSQHVASNKGIFFLFRHRNPHLPPIDRGLVFDSAGVFEPLRHIHVNMHQGEVQNLVDQSTNTKSHVRLITAAARSNFREESVVLIGDCKQEACRRARRTIGPTTSSVLP